MRTHIKVEYCFPHDYDKKYKIDIEWVSIYQVNSMGVERRLKDIEPNAIMLGYGPGVTFDVEKQEAKGWWIWCSGEIDFAQWSYEDGNYTYWGC